MSLRSRYLPTLLVLLLSAFVGSLSAEERLEREYFKSGVAFRNVFRDVVAAANAATVRISSDKDQVALGTIVDADGYILTKASELRGEVVCELRDGQTLVAEIVGIDRDTDLAMLKIDATGLPTVRWSPETLVEAGQWFVSPGMNDAPLAVGVVSVPLRKMPTQRGVLGISIEDVEAGPRISYVHPSSGAERAGLKIGDVVMQVAGEGVKTANALASRIGNHRPGELLDLVILRGEEQLEIQATLGFEMPSLRGFDRQSYQNQMGGRLSRRRNGFPSVIQHDSVLRPQDCGGPVVNLSGDAVGVNIARAGRIESYTIPASIVQNLLPELKSGKLAPPKALVAEEKLVSEDTKGQAE